MVKEEAYTGIVFGCLPGCVVAKVDESVRERSLNFGLVGIDLGQDYMRGEVVSVGSGRDCSVGDVVYWPKRVPDGLYFFHGGVRYVRLRERDGFYAFGDG